MSPHSRSASSSASPQICPQLWKRRGWWRRRSDVRSTHGLSVCGSPAGLLRARGVYGTAEDRCKTDKIVLNGLPRNGRLLRISLICKGMLRIRSEMAWGGRARRAAETGYSIFRASMVVLAIRVQGMTGRGLVGTAPPLTSNQTLRNLAAAAYLPPSLGTSYEAHLSAKCSPPQAQARFSCPHAHSRRAGRPQAPS